MSYGYSYGEPTVAALPTTYAAPSLGTTYAATPTYTGPVTYAAPTYAAPTTYAATTTYAAPTSYTVPTYSTPTYATPAVSSPATQFEFSAPAALPTPTVTSRAVEVIQPIEQVEIAQEMGKLDEAAALAPPPGADPNVTNMYTQIRDLMEVQKGLKNDVKAIKAQVNENFQDIEELRRMAGWAKDSFLNRPMPQPQPQPQPVPATRDLPPPEKPKPAPSKDKKKFGCC